MVQPSANEQYMLEMINRARLDPTAEGNSYNITVTNAPVQPLAFNEFLIDSSLSHGQWMIDENKFQHVGVNNTSPKQRMQNAGYQFSGSQASGENIAYQPTFGTVDETYFTELLHKALFLSSGHRSNILSSSYREMGIGNKIGFFQGYNSLVITQNFARSGTDVFLTGVAYDDLVTDDDFYTVGEGLSGIEVAATNTSNGNSYSTDTMNAGGYQMVLPPGTYNVGFFDNGQLLGDLEQVTIASENIKLDLNTNNIVVPDRSGNDTIYGSGGNDYLYGEAGSDRLYGYAGNDLLNGGADNDSLYGHDGDDTLIGGAGTDRVLEFADVNFTLTNSQLTGRGTDSLSQIEQVFFKGGASSNTFNASNASQINVTLDGGGGHDTLIGGANGDILLGGGGDDLLEGGDGNDRLSGHNGNDLLKGDDGNDRLFGNNGNDLLEGGNGNDRLFGNDGNDTLIGGQGVDLATGGAGSDVFALEQNSDKITIIDFQDGSDMLGLTGSLGFSDLNIINHSVQTGVVIRDSSNNDEVLAYLRNVDAANISVSDFTSL
ncbi:MAG: CAP domain-containing protein [Cyanobacteria bacterium P01_G01_bin.19]